MIPRIGRHATVPLWQPWTLTVRRVATMGAFGSSTRYFRAVGRDTQQCRVREQVRLPLIRIATNEPVEALEPHAGGPLAERPNLTRGARGRVVVAPVMSAARVSEHNAVE